MSEENIKKCIKVLKDYKTNLFQQLDSLQHVLECTLNNYDFMINFAIKKGYKRVVDIGCAYGHQSELCTGRIKYLGIDEDDCDFYKETLARGYIVGKYPEEIDGYTFWKSDLAIANLSIGWNCYNNEEEFDEICKHLKKDFTACLLYIPIERKKYYQIILNM